MLLALPLVVRSFNVIVYVAKLSFLIIDCKYKDNI